MLERLRRRHVPVRIGSRRGEPPFSWTDESTWVAALHEIDRVYVLHPLIGAPDTADQVARFSTKAAAAGVSRLVLLTAHGYDESPEQQAVESAGTEWTIVRPSWFAQNFDDDFMGFRTLLRDGNLTLPFRHAAFAFVDADDIADVAVAALTESGHHGKAYDVTGPESLDYFEVAERFSQILGRSIRYTPVTSEQFVDRMSDLGSPSDPGAVFAADDDVREAVAHGVNEALGHPPKSLDSYITTMAATGVWNPAAD
ncbi:NmrA family NAD(P)-binding protein [Gordonia hydrophobica]|uniref:NmrA family NAD(P)-binding protein n=1 Tax=Gordonia hydrophobica TaxID=40516 RepID=A0ABZ2TX74_9ACTN|nr:NmrA family NAD(P)-binding protein [Gordonia hydrophobica]MBM7366292.1 uncharacterized protein YbjT (DUF2867 family) [Gordonia hydrophobica]